MNRFQSKISFSPHKIWTIGSLVFLSALFLIFFSSIQQIDESTQKEQMRSLQETLQRDIAQCYALEGTYPPDLIYLEEHYGLFYDKKRYYVDYISIGSNIYPDVSIIPIGAEDD